MDVQLPVDEIDLWVGSVSRVCLMLSGVAFIEGIVVLGWVVVLLLTLLRCCNNT